MASILIDHHNKLGDHLICNGLVREYAKRYERVGVFCRPEYQESVSFMLRDLKNAEIEVVADHRHKQYFLLRHAWHLTARHYGEVKRVYNDPEVGILAERQFYGLAGLPHVKKWESFYVTRDRAREDGLYQKLAPRGPYVFVHDDSTYGGNLDKARLPTTPAVVPLRDITNNIFDYCLLIERAAEVHVVDSVFMFLADLLPYQTPGQKLVVHRYARTNPPWYLPVLKKDWIILQ